LSKVIPLAIDAQLATAVRTLAYTLTITRQDGEVFAMTEHSSALTVDGVSHLPGLAVGSLASACGLEVDNGEFELIYGSEPLVGTADLLSGVWDGAEVLIRQVNWMSPSDGWIGHKRGHVGNIKRGLGSAKVEFRDLRQALRTDTTSVMQPNCRYRLGNAKCTVNLAPLTFAGTITGVISQRVFQAAALTQDVDYFTEGYVTFYTGTNTGKRIKVSSFLGGIVTLDIDPIGEVSEGDQFLIVAGCMKRFQPDCVVRFNNGLNYGGEKDKPSVADVVRDPNQ
jgi:uncharacterized phage protein (TIGR02218 family)